MTPINRRQFVGTSSAGLAIAPLATLLARSAQGKVPRALGFGPLTPKFPLNMVELPVELQNTAFVQLPDQFEYTALSTVGQLLSDGNPVPTAHDGMAVFKGRDGTTILVRNHENSTGGTPVRTASGLAYDPAVTGGTTNIVLDKDLRVIEHYGSLAGTERNCAGGPTPWDTWLTCEETTAIRNGVRHGYVFEVPSLGEASAVPLRGLGRFNHEAAAVDPKRSVVYLTEDRGDSCLYRFVPARYGDLRSPGRLEALRLLDWPEGVATNTGFLDLLYTPLATDWVPVLDFDPETDTVRLEAQSQGAATFSRGEGCWFGDGKIYFVCSNGGEIGSGQVFAYDIRKSTLTLFVESTDATVLQAPDNITVAPDGQLYLCEDGSGTDNIVGVNRDGELFLAVMNNINGSEFAGACFADDVMFVNTQSPGVTYAIRGPWRQYQDRKRQERDHDTCEDRKRR